MARPKHKSISRRARPAILAAGLLLAIALAGWLARRTPAPEPEARATFHAPDRVVFAAYAGSQSCRECHATAFDAWSKSHHALAEREVNSGIDRAAFDPARSITHGTQISEARATEDGFRLITRGASGSNEAFQLTHVIGVAPLRQFLVPAGGGRFQATELAFDPAKHEWFDVFGNEDRQPGEWGHWTGRGMTWNQMCASCHNTRLRKHYNAATDSYATTMAERGVSCESCHGPMADHVKWQRARPQPGTGDPTVRKLDHGTMMAACGACHARRSELTGEFQAGDRFLDHYLLTIPDESDLYHADGQVRDENYEYASFLGSKMFAAGVWCMDCHEPHSAMLRASDNSLCMRCHSTPLPPAPRIEEATHSFHRAGQPGSRCVDCHMPQTTYMQRHPRRDHAFTIPDPLLTKEHGIPNACNRCHADKDAEWSLAAVDKWYGKRMERPSRARARTIARARAGETNAVPDLMGVAREDRIGLWRSSATRLLRNHAGLPGVRETLAGRASDQNPLVRANAAHALGPLAEAGDVVARAAIQRLLADESRAVRVEAGWALHERLDTNSPAGRDLLHSLAFNVDQPAGAAQFGSFLLNRGDPAAALAWFEKAVTWDPNSAALHDAHAVCLSALGRVADAVRAMEQACRVAPRDAQYRYRLGLALSEAGRLNEAVSALEQTVQLEAGFASAWYNLGLGYSQQGRNDEALTALLRAESLDDRAARIPYARATILARTGRIAEARRAAQRALEIQRDLAEARELLRALESP